MPTSSDTANSDSTLAVLVFIPHRMKPIEDLYSSLAQSVEHLTVNQGVVGSSPTGGAKKKGTANGRALLTTDKAYLKCEIGFVFG